MGKRDRTLRTVVEVAGNLDPSLRKAVDGASKTLGKVNWKAAAVGAAVGGIAIAAGKAVADAGKYLTALGDQFQEATNAIRIGTGATGEALDGLLGDFDEIYRSVPSSMGAVSTAVADLNTRLGLSGPALRTLSTQALQVSDMLGEDLTRVIKESSESFQIWKVDADRMSGAMDYVFKASQSTGVGFTDLMAKTQRFAPQLKELGYSFEESVALVGQMEKAGLDADEALGAMKRSVGTLAKEGLSASDGMRKYCDEIQRAGTVAEATAIANKVFGTRAGSTMATAIRDGTLAVGDLTSELTSNGETIAGAAEETYTFHDRLQLFRQQAEVALKPLANTLLDELGRLLPVVGEVMEGLTPVLRDVSSAMVPLFRLIGPLAGAVFDLIGPVVTLAARALKPLIGFVTSLIGPLVQLMSRAIAPLIGGVIKLMDYALLPLRVALGAVELMFASSFGEVVVFAAAQVERLRAVFVGLIGFVRDVFTGQWGSAWEGIRAVFGTIMEGLGATFKLPLNVVIGAINGLLTGLNKIQIPDWVPVVGGKGLAIPPLPLLASGGFTRGVSIAGEAGTEAVISFDPAHRKENVQYWAQAGELLGVLETSGVREQAVLAASQVQPLGEAPASGAVASAGRLVGGGETSLTEASSGGVTYDLGGATFAPQITIHGDAEKRDIVRLLEEEYERFVDFLEDCLCNREMGRYASYHPIS